MIRTLPGAGCILRKKVKSSSECFALYTAFIRFVENPATIAKLKIVQLLPRLGIRKIIRCALPFFHIVHCSDTAVPT